MQRIILHWTAGAHQPNALDLAHYHYVIAGDGRVIPGQFPIEANRGPLQKGRYAAHTRNCNSGSIGIAFAAMRGAVERPFSAGDQPITALQLAAMVGLCQRLCRDHAIPISRETLLSHAEVSKTLGLAQRGKWDVTWLPNMAAPAPALVLGDRLRALISASPMRHVVEGGAVPRAVGLDQSPQSGPVKAVDRSTQVKRGNSCKSMLEFWRAMLRGLWSPMG